MANRPLSRLRRSLPDETISANESYTIEQFRAKTGLGDYSWRRISKLLPVKVIGRKHYVLGRDWIDLLTRLEESEVAS